MENIQENNPVTFKLETELLSVHLTENTVCTEKKKATDCDTVNLAAIENV